MADAAGRVLLLLLLLAGAGRAAAHGPIDEALERADQAVERAPDDPAARLARGELLRVRGDHAAALAELARGEALGADARVHFYRGRLLLDAGDARAAAASFARYAALRPDDPLGHAFSGRALAAIGRRPPALAAYDRALALAPRSQFYYERASLLADAAQATDADVARALAGLDEARERLGLVTPLELYAVELELRRGRHDAALARLARLEARAAAKASWRARRAEILERAKRPDEARRAWLDARAALTALPPSRRTSRDGAELERRIDTALARLEPRP